MSARSNITKRFSEMDGHMREVLTGASLAFVLRIFGAAAAFALNVLIGRLLGAEGAGLYFLALSVALIASILAQLGLANTLLRFISAGAANNDWGQIKGVFSQGIKYASVASVGLAILMAATASWSAEYIFDKPALTAPLRYMSLAVISFSLMTLLAESLKGLKQIGRSMLVTGVIYPLVALVLIWPLATVGGVTGASLAYVIGTLVAALAGAYWWHRTVRDHGPARPLASAELWQSARPLLVMNLIVRGVIPMAPLFLVGIWSSAEDAGILGAATRLALLASFFLAAVNTAIAPKFSELYTKGDMVSLARVTRRFALGITLATSPLFLVLFFAGDWVMSLFGPDFTRGGSTLAILAVGQLVNSMFGAAVFLLMMSGNEKDVRTASLIAAAVLTLLLLTLVPSYGLIGAAISASAAYAALTLWSAFMVGKRLGVQPFSLVIWKSPKQ